MFCVVCVPNMVLDLFPYSIIAEFSYILRMSCWKTSVRTVEFVTETY